MTALQDHQVWSAVRPAVRMQRWRVGIMVLMVCCPVYATVAQEMTGDGDPAGALPAFVNGLWKTIPPDGDHHPTATLFIRFTDFGCVPCLNNFLDVCDTIAQAMRVHGSRPVALVFMRDRRERSDQERILHRWASVHRIHFPVFVAPENFFTTHFLDYSTFVVLDREGEFIFFEKFPLSAEKLHAVTDILFGKRW